MIWVTVDPNSELPIEDFLSGYDALLAEFGFETWHYPPSTCGWSDKVAYDGTSITLPILHRETFGTEIGNKANYYSWGPHTHMGRPDETWAEFEDAPEEDWPIERLLTGVWTIFPHISIASFDAAVARS